MIDKKMFAHKLLLIFSIVSLSAIAGEPTTVHPPQELRRSQGYLLVDLNLERDVGKIMIGRRAGPLASKFLRTKDYVSLGPLPAGRHLYLLALPEGDYQWTQISVPHYDLPHIVETAEDSGWQINIEAGRINYSGQIVVRESRSSDSVQVALLNRIAYTHAELLNAYPTELQTMAWSYAGYGHDLFIEAMNRQTEQAQ